MLINLNNSNAISINKPIFKILDFNEESYMLSELVIMI